MESNSAIQISIDKAVVANMPKVIYPGNITVIDSTEKAHHAIEILSRASIVGFDTETRPSFRKGQVNHVALMQISTDNECFLFRINRIGMTESLRRFIENAEITKVGLSLRDDFTVMHRSNEFVPASFIDLQQIVRNFCITDLSLQRIYAILFGERISKHQRLSNWEADVLTEAQQIYASIDAWACLRIYRHLQSGAFDPHTCPYRYTPETDSLQDENKTL